MIPSGVYCAPTGTITVNANGVSGEVTFVAQTIVLGGQHTTFTPQHQGLLAYQTGPAMVTIMSGNQVSLTGIIYAPDAEVELDGNSTSFFTGLVEAHDVWLHGNNMHLTGTGPPGDPGSNSVVFTG